MFTRGVDNVHISLTDSLVKGSKLEVLEFPDHVRVSFLCLLGWLHRQHHLHRFVRARRCIEGVQTGKGEGPEGGGSLGELGEGPGVGDFQRCWGCSEQSYKGRI